VFRVFGFRLIHKKFTDWVNTVSLTISKALIESMYMHHNTFMLLAY